MQLVLKALAGMFGLFYGLFQYIFQKEELRILILGASLLRPPHPSRPNPTRDTAFPPGSERLTP